MGRGSGSAMGPSRAQAGSHGGRGIAVGLHFRRSNSTTGRAAASRRCRRRSLRQPGVSPRQDRIVNLHRGRPAVVYSGRCPWRPVGRPGQRPRRPPAATTRPAIPRLAIPRSWCAANRSTIRPRPRSRGRPVPHPREGADLLAMRRPPAPRPPSRPRPVADLEVDDRRLPDGEARGAPGRKLTIGHATGFAFPGSRPTRHGPPPLAGTGASTSVDLAGRSALGGGQGHRLGRRPSIRSTITNADVRRPRVRARRTLCWSAPTGGPPAGSITAAAVCGGRPHGRCEGVTASIATGQPDRRSPCAIARTPRVDRGLGLRQDDRGGGPWPQARAGGRPRPPFPCCLGRPDITTTATPAGARSAGRPGPGSPPRGPRPRGWRSPP